MAVAPKVSLHEFLFLHLRIPYFHLSALSGPPRLCNEAISTSER